ILGPRNSADSPVADRPTPPAPGGRKESPPLARGGRVSANLPSGGRCQVCAHPRLDAIEAELVKVGTVKRALARSLGIGRMSLQRHAQLHLPERLWRASEAAKKA